MNGPGAHETPIVLFAPIWYHLATHGLADDIVVQPVTAAPAPVGAAAASNIITQSDDADVLLT
jgi:hypothetical protein